MYRLKIKARALKDLRTLAPVYQNKIAATIRALAGNPKPQGAIKLTDREEWRVRQGDYRILYTIDDNVQEITVVRIKHRREVYDR
ncbi:MAG: type II toxin-antitoxin system RelE/ParE family toxin [Actinomycetota bacterium]|nr:type II toxin-antitoxin system RelE/ParE family toxin [Actinomycetota bacterium]